MINKITRKIRLKYFKCGMWVFPGRNAHFGLLYGDFAKEKLMDTIYFEYL